MYRWACVVLTLSLWLGAAARGAEPVRIDIADPQRHWRDQGFVELTPAIRVSVAPGARTAIYLKVPDGARIAGRRLPSPDRATLQMPPGSASDRVSFTAALDGQWTVDDVRGTRWGGDGREYFHVYRPRGPDLHAPLVGYEWPRDDPHLAIAATRLLSDLVRDTPAPLSAMLPSWGEVARFRMLNRCESCHVADKPMAADDRAALPSWATDGSGLYVPLAVLADRAPLSTSRMFHDPNIGEAFVTATCGDMPAREHMGRRSRWFSCPDDAVPMGILDVAAGLAAGNPHVQRVCASRRYLFDRLDPAGRQAFAPAFAACGIA